MKSRFKVIFTAVLAAGILFGCSDDGEEAVSSRAYKGHDTDADIANFVQAYPDTVGTRLDDCQTCHTGGTVTTSKGDQFKSPCDFCHYIPHPDEDIQGTPSAYTETLNPYGTDYNLAGRTKDALESIKDDDSDADGHSNRDEIDDLKYPGDAGSMPGQLVVPIRVMELAELQALTGHEEFILANSHKQQFDNYANYLGVKVIDLLEAVGVDTAAIDGITVIAPDGYTKDFSVEDINNAFPGGVFYSGLDTATLGTDCGFVEYPATIPAGVIDGGTIPGEPWLLLAYERDGTAMETSYLDPTDGKINGEGPFRIVVPQSDPGAPDRGSSYSPTTCDDGYDYDDTADHNAGAMVRGVIAIRVNPIPAGYEEFDYLNGGWAYIDANQLVVYGAGVEVE